MSTLLALLLSMPALASDRTTVEIRRADKSVASFKAELATDPDSRARGLMFRKKLASNAGMLFVYDEPGRRAFWMKNTLIPLDMLFFNQKGELVYIHSEATPEDLTPLGPNRNDICAILEIAGGQAARQKIKVGDRLVVENGNACLP
ncbi:MAG: DUF192 domain-containing protein [Alphaproteobacteria bacterium]|nr:DUF192 domain-containing protein [Alphaproteobacteria bacterium]